MLEYEEFLKILDYWNSKKIIRHKPNMPGITPMLNMALKQYAIEQIKEAMDHYAIMFHDPTYLYCKYKWALPKFLFSNRFVAFLGNGSKWLNYCKFKKWQSHNPETIKPVELDLKTVNYYKYTGSEHWKQFRKAALEHYSYTCQMCGATNVKLDVHHKTYDTRGKETLEDVLVLCRPCHSKLHKDKGEYTSTAYRDLLTR
ncbi:MAG TPA: hypothetical protein DCZ10_11305 [Pelotomaculum sp.]|nr:hypothetical protein [Pelotomaculum sp.]